MVKKIEKKIENKERKKKETRKWLKERKQVSLNYTLIINLYLKRTCERENN